MKGPFINSLKSIIKTLFFKLEYFLFKKIIKGKNAWRLFDEAGVDGFGVNLIRLYFPIYYDKKTKRETFSIQVENIIKQVANVNFSNQLNPAIINELQHIIRLPVHQTDPGPYLDNYYFGIYDAAVLAAIMQNYKPAKIIEIGSGISTRYINYFKNKFSLATKVVCIDPNPRVDIDNSADLIIKKPFENVITDDIFSLQSNDIVFIDGSHYVFQGNDTLNFFFNLLPALPKGVIIHIHDIYLPFDYPENVARQLWTEQYILTAMILGGFNGFEVIYPNYYISQTNNNIKQALAAAGQFLKLSEFKTKLNHTEGYSFWLRKI